MTTKTTTTERNGATPEQQLDNNRMLINMFILALTLLFICLIYANLIVRNAQGQWPPKEVNRLDMLTPIAMTLILLASSATAVLGTRAAKQGNPQRVLMFISITSVLGMIYAVWMIGFLINILNHFNGVYSAMFLALWFVHVLHALAVLGFMGYVIQKLRGGSIDMNPAMGYFPVEASTKLWHFLTVIWIVLFVVLYLI
jgi:heme/copper-type cytochrome/quinol oxidase subunit 3